MIDINSSTHAVRLDPASFDALLAAARDSSAPAPVSVSRALATDWVDDLMRVIVDPVVELRLVVAGPVTRVEHRGWLADGALALLLWVRPELRQLMQVDAAFLTATLVRLTRMRPRPARRPAGPSSTGGGGPAGNLSADRLDELVSDDPSVRERALADADADFAWRLHLLSVDGGERALTAVDGEAGLRLADPVEQRLVPVTNTVAYRILSTVLVPA